MNRNKKPMVFYVTVPSHEVGEKLAEGLVSNRLVACVNIVGGIKSIYRWKGKIEKDDESLMVIKSIADKADQIIEFIIGNHPYEMPECIGINIEKGSADYLDWIADCVL